MNSKPKLVLVGNGMAGVRTLEELLKIAPGLYDITVRNQNGDLIAMFRGRSYRLGERKVFEA